MNVSRIPDSQTLWKQLQEQFQPDIINNIEFGYVIQD